MRVAGAMSGTSMDGVDLAVIETDGVAVLGFGETRYRPYGAAERAAIRAALGRWPGEPGVAEAARVVEDAHLEVLAGLEGVAAFGFHGQTLAHDPEGRRTHQAGDGARVAAAAGLTTVWDFRSNDMAFGGQGAPLAPFYHWALARFIGAAGPVAFLNLGGVGNISWVNPRLPRPEEPGACLAFDTGPANAPIDDLVRVRLGEGFDRDGRLTRAGRVDAETVAVFLDDIYFRRMPPKSLDRDAFPRLAEWVAGMADADAVATLAACCAGAVAQGLEHLPARPGRLFVTGGGRLNPGLMEMLAVATGCEVAPVEAVGLDGDFLEAQAFAYLAARVLLGLPTSAPGTTGVAAAVGGGRVSRV
ncbi:anhydro-N-acetylmuramic acid kinase [Roseicyclus persicicus]|uniref:Anhydro-N-acetylmuramic acid kinase n=1 Tax=Roseicyclus persicicus TaxID=2650661 RepID=A0A7X6H0P0_9RHOB|nr:anhydro-N-acetylmuramic acid kinase [Roseibacterium persicicum]NKX45828.1 anhydro-N-acetylmuramic acid kinase [Roseibacterium persicicum]